jgi:hypothetical protein
MIERTSSAPAGAAPPNRAPLQDDRLDCLRRIKIVHAPMYNLVFRSSVCRCRLGGDSSPFAPVFDLHIPEPCRLHAFDPIVHLLDQPPEGYDPATDPYFDQFGGHAAFAALIAVDPVAENSIAIHKILPKDDFDRAVAALGAALRDEQKRTALLSYVKEMHEDYFQWRKMPEGGEKAARDKKERGEKAKLEQQRGRRGSM